MCGIIGYCGREPAAPLIHDGLSLLQHRGQDAAGIAAMSGAHLFIHKGYGLARAVFDRRHMEALRGSIGVGHVRYPTSGGARAASEIQPFYVNQPYGMTLVHNGNLTNHRELRSDVAENAMRHINSDSDSEALLNALAHLLSERCAGGKFSADAAFDAVAELHRRCRGAYAVVALVAGEGMLAFRDPLGIRPLALGARGGGEWMVASESVALRPLGFSHLGDVAPGEAVFVSAGGEMRRRQCADRPRRTPCIFEYIYFARPDAIMEGVLVYEARLNMGRRLARLMRDSHSDLPIDCVIPVPDSARPAAMELARELRLDYREGLVKNRYTGRTFIMSGQERRRRSVREKLNAVEPEFRGKNVLLVDDSIVRGTTGRELVELARGAGARRVFFASASPPICWPNVYGIDTPTRTELLAAGRDARQVAARLGADRVVYQTLEDVLAAVRELNPDLKNFEACCFSGEYPTGDVTESYLAELEILRAADRDEQEDSAQLPLELPLGLAP